MDLTYIAEQIADNMQAQRSGIEHELTQIEKEQTELNKRKAALLESREAARLAHERLAQFSGTECPSCWMQHGLHGTLRAVGGGTDNYDLVRCNICDRQWESSF